jgi:hypothetical protein
LIQYYEETPHFPTWETIDYYFYESVDEHGRFVFRNRFDRNSNAKKDQVAGCYTMKRGEKEARYQLRLNNKFYREVGKLLWILHNKKCWPSDENGKALLIDHIDGNPENNFIWNLRPVTPQQNMYNSKIPSTNTSGYKGVSWHKDTKKWRSKIQHNNKFIHIGCYTDLHEAAEAYNVKAKELFGEYARLNVILKEEKGE